MPLYVHRHVVRPEIIRGVNSILCSDYGWKMGLNVPAKGPVANTTDERFETEVFPLVAGELVRP